MSAQGSVQNLVVIPARYGSSRFPGKPLVHIGGKSIIQRVYEQCLKSSADFVVIATDDERIVLEAKKFGAPVLLTSDAHLNGSSRCAEVLDILQKQDKMFDLVVNVQGDEPFIAPENIDALIKAARVPMVQILSLFTPFQDESDVHNPNKVKVVMTQMDDSGLRKALYFSRLPIPFLRDNDHKHTFYRHIGLYAYQSDTLQQIAKLSPGILEQAEHLEQLRWLENNMSITMTQAVGAETPAVDHPDDLQAVENFLKTHVGELQ